MERTEKKSKVLGILGGLGPMASVYFYEMLTQHTRANCDQEHLDLVLSSRASTPDRTAYITGESEVSPLAAMTEEAKRLEAFGAGLIVMPCNTAHYFYDSISCAVSVPMLNIIDETVDRCISLGFRHPGLMATTGTIETATYQRKCRKKGIVCSVPDEENQKKVMKLIYGEIKQGKEPDMTEFYGIAETLRADGCDCIILGCTELSLIKRSHPLGREFVDSIEALAYSSILACGKEPVGFDF